VEGVGNMNKKYFYLEESPYYPGKYRVAINFDTLLGIRTAGSYNLLPARLLCLSYAEYLRFCRDELGAEITGKKCMYPVAYFPNKASAAGLIDNLNARMALVEYNRARSEQCI
jgi:hypothetical protein